MIQPLENITTNNFNILIRLTKQQRMPHPLVNLQTLIHTLSLVKQLLTHIRIRNRIRITMQHNKRYLHLTQPPTQILSHSQQLHNRPQPRLPRIPHRIHPPNYSLLRHLHRLINKIFRRYNC
ncbi:hypothetical protein HanHA300_Chr16g0616701 [Helianthus annuus]|nr:hypothetical protein HanHA300_Chr16g0616701 [Helianthus annuus]KAJ0645339.1 hypothetical protein HanOQP8_Chr16g0622781 [Helianthus annuus]